MISSASSRRRRRPTPPRGRGGVVEHGAAREDRGARPAPPAPRRRRAGSTPRATGADGEDELGVERAAPQLGHGDALDGGAEGRHDVAQQVVGHRAGHLPPSRASAIALASGRRRRSAAPALPGLLAQQDDRGVGRQLEAHAPAAPSRPSTGSYRHRLPLIRAVAGCGAQVGRCAPAAPGGAASPAAPHRGGRGPTASRATGAGRGGPAASTWASPPGRRSWLRAPPRRLVHAEVPGLDP
jgi:hypothetical protein